MFIKCYLASVASNLYEESKISQTYLGPYQPSLMEPFYGNSCRSLAVYRTRTELNGANLAAVLPFFKDNCFSDYKPS